MTDWIKGRELLEPPYSLTKRGIFNAVKEGALVPWESPDGDRTNRAWRIFPTPELQKEWLQILAIKELDLEGRLERAKEYSQKTDEEIIEKDRFFRLKFMEEQNSEKEESEKLVNLIEKIPELRQRWAQEILQLPLQIKNLENKLENDFAPNRVWKDLDLGFAQQELLMERLLDVGYELDNVEASLGVQSETPAPKTQPAKTTLHCKPGTKWEDIEIILIANDTVRIKTPEWSKRCSYHELGLSDKRKGDVPKKLWELLTSFAKMNGFISRENPKYDSKLPNKAKRLNYHFQNLFKINETIYQGHYRQEGGYKTKIKFKDNTFHGPESISQSSIDSYSYVTCQKCGSAFNLQDHPDECPYCGYHPPLKGGVIDNMNEVGALFDEIQNQYKDAVISEAFGRYKDE